jgi:acetyl esterase/lipase
MFTQRAKEVGELPPIRIFWGDEDALIPHSHGEALAAATEGIELVVFPGAGHYLHQQQPEAFVEALRAFLDAPELPHARLRPRARSQRASKSHSERIAQRWRTIERAVSRVEVRCPPPRRAVRAIPFPLRCGR